MAGRRRAESEKVPQAQMPLMDLSVIPRTDIGVRSSGGKRWEGCKHQHKGSEPSAPSATGSITKEDLDKGDVVVWTGSKD